MSLRYLILLICLTVSSLTSFAGGDKKNFHMPDFVDPGNIQIVRDSFGVPHIFAPTDAEVAYGLGWATLEDDSETAQFLFYAAKMKLGRYIGVDGAAVDYAVQLTRVRQVAAEYLEQDCPDDFRRVLDGYCAGVNSYLSHHWDELSVKSAFPLEPVDVISGYMLGMALMAGVDGAMREIVEGTIQENIPMLPDAGTPIGSNFIAMNGNKTTDGNTYLDINSHQPLEGLLSWYEAHLCSEEGWNITGGLFHGGVSVFHGTNENLGWAHTVGNFDKKDIFVLKMKEGSKELYKFGDEWKTLEQSHAKLRVGLGKKNRFVLPVRKKIWWSEFGPTIRTKSGAFALRMPALMEPGTAEQWWRMNKAKDFDEFKEVLSMQGLSQMNIGYADRDGNIYLLANGLIPKRKEGLDWEQPVWGTDASVVWDEFYTIDELAHFENPACGYLFNVNNSAFHGTCSDENLNPDDFADNMGYGLEVNNRSARFYELMREYDKVSWEDFKKIKFDYTYPSDTLYFMKDFDVTIYQDMTGEDYPGIADALELMHAWDRTADSLDTNYPILLYSLYEIYNRADKAKIDEIRDDVEARKKYFADCILTAKNHMIRHFGTIELKTSQVHVLERGGKFVPMNGGPEMLRNAAANKMEDGRLRIWVGDSFIQMVKFTKEGPPEIYSISPFGATNKPDRAHYDDQMEMFSRQEFKKMSLDKQYWLDNAEQIYSPQ